DRARAAFLCRVFQASGEPRTGSARGGMKILTLLRHAKSGWDDPVKRDFDRPLNPRGRRAARTVGREMRNLGLAYDRVVASPARRVVETIEEVAHAFGPLEPDYDERVYLAPTATLV